MAWRHIEQGNRGEQAEALVAALGKANTSQPRAATAALDKIIAEGNGAYRSAALIQQANMKAQTGDMKAAAALMAKVAGDTRSEEHTSELQSLMRISYAVFCLKKKNKEHNNNYI